MSTFGVQRSHLWISLLLWALNADDDSIRRYFAIMHRIYCMYGSAAGTGNAFPSGGAPPAAAAASPLFMTPNAGESIVLGTPLNDRSLNCRYLSVIFTYWFMISKN